MNEDTKECLCDNTWTESILSVPLILVTILNEHKPSLMQVQMLVKTRNSVVEAVQWVSLGATRQYSFVFTSQCCQAAMVGSLILYINGNIHWHIKTVNIYCTWKYLL